MLDLVLTLSKKLVDSLGAGLSLVLQVLRPFFHFGVGTFFHNRGLMGLRLKVNLDAMYITYTLSKIREIISLRCIHT